jgi:hypothetical protein
MTGGQVGRSPGPPLRTAAVGGLAFTVLYLVHRILQGTGPDNSAPAAVADYHLAHRPTLLASEVAVGLALLAFIPFLAALVPVIWRAGQETLAVAVAISGAVFVAMGFVSNAADTALIGVADSNQPAAVLTLDQLQGRTPIVWTITALVAVVSLAIQRTGLVWRWLGVAGLVAAAIFLLGSVFSVVGRTPRGELLTAWGWPLHRMDAAVERRPVARRGKQNALTPVVVGSPVHWPPTAWKTRWV